MRTVLNKMLEDKVKSLKEFIESYIETYQTCLNTTNPDFLLELVKSSKEMQDAYVTTYSGNINNSHYVGSKQYIAQNNEQQLKDEEEMKKQLFKQMLCGLNDLDTSIETSKQVKMHRNLTNCYFNFIRKNVRDFVPKRIQHKMINIILDEFDSKLDEYVFTPYVINRTFEEVLKEEESIIEDRKRAEQLLDAVNKALENMLYIQCF